jgi:uncharacterized protein YggU (UPF0235/DUF167 family)
VRFTVHVRPNASATRVGGVHDGALVVRVTAPAEHGKATAAVLDALADAVGVPRRAVSLASGAASRRKVVDLDAAPADEAALASRLEQLRRR